MRPQSQRALRRPGRVAAAPPAPLRCAAQRRRVLGRRPVGHQCRCCRRTCRAPLLLLPAALRCHRRAAAAAAGLPVAAAALPGSARAPCAAAADKRAQLPLPLPLLLPLLLLLSLPLLLPLPPLVLPPLLGRRGSRSMHCRLLPAPLPARTLRTQTLRSLPPQLRSLPPRRRPLQGLPHSRPGPARARRRAGARWCRPWG